MHSLGKFLDEVPEVDHINLFLTSIGYVFHRRSHVIATDSNDCDTYIISFSAGRRETLVRLIVSAMAFDLNWRQEIQTSLATSNAY